MRKIKKFADIVDQAYDEYIEQMTEVQGVDDVEFRRKRQKKAEEDLGRAVAHAYDLMEREAKDEKETKRGLLN